MTRVHGRVDDAAHRARTGSTDAPKGASAAQEAPPATATDLLVKALWKQAETFLAPYESKAEQALRLDAGTLRNAATALAQDPKVLKAGRSAFEMAANAVSGPKTLDSERLTRIVEGAEAFLPRTGQQFLAAVLKNASRDGLLKLDPTARREFVGWVAKLDAGDGGLKTWDQALDKNDGAKRTTPFIQEMKESPFFEDQVMAFFMQLALNIQDDTKEKMKAYKEAVASEDQALQRGQDDRLSRVSDIARDTGCGQALEAATRTGGIDVERTRRTLEAVVNSAHDHVRDDGVLDAGEAGAIAKKLARLPEPVAGLVADAMLNALRRTGLDLGGAIKPVVEWAATTLRNRGIEPDLTPLPRMDPRDPADPVAAELKKSPRVEDRIASYLVDVFLTSDTSLRDKMSALRSLHDDIQDNLESQSVAPPAAHGPGLDAPHHDATATPGAAPHSTEADPRLEHLLAEAVTTTPPAPELPRNDRPVRAPRMPDGDGEKPRASREQLAEEHKQLAQEYSAIVQALSNLSSMFHQNAMNAIRQFRS